MEDDLELRKMEKLAELLRIGLTFAVVLILINELAKAESPALQASISQTISSVLSTQPQVRQQHPLYQEEPMY